MASLKSKPKTLGDRLRLYRKRRKLSQLALAHEIGHRGKDAGAYISRVESGLWQPNLNTLTRISKALKISLHDLL